jgi:hypothetical protein
MLRTTELGTCRDQVERVDQRVLWQPLAILGPVVGDVNFIVVEDVMIDPVPPLGRKMKKR